MSEADFYALYYIIMVPLNVIIWSVVLADTAVGRWITDNPVSRRYIVPLWDRMKGAVRTACRIDKQG
jgi:hypothetical protein